METHWCTHCWDSCNQSAGTDWGLQTVRLSSPGPEDQSLRSGPWHGAPTGAVATEGLTSQPVPVLPQEAARRLEDSESFTRLGAGRGATLQSRCLGKGEGAGFRADGGTAGSLSRDAGAFHLLTVRAHFMGRPGWAVGPRCLTTPRVGVAVK